MRIGIDARLIDAFGIGSYVRGLLSGLASLEGGEEYVVFVPSHARGRIPKEFETIVADVPPYTIRELVQMARIAGRARLDLFHVPHFLVPWTSCRIVTTLFDAIPFHYPLPNPVAGPYIAWMMQNAADRAQRILTISHAAKRDLLGALDVPPEKIAVAHIGLEEMFFRESVEPPVERRPYFVFSGKAARHKNLETLLEALAIARRSDPSLRLVLAGRDHERFRARDGVDVPGFLSEEELLALYRGALAVVMPSFMEGFGLPPLEGMALGTPAITSTADALVEVTGDAALHVDPRSASDLADALLRIAHDPALRADLSARGRIHARSFTWRRCAEETRNVYRAAVRQSHS